MRDWRTWTVALLAAMWCLFQACLPEAGYPSIGWDYGAHVSIVRDVMAGRVLPFERGRGLGPHAIAWWMPLYGGILGSHVAAAALSALGLATPQAMQLLGNVSLVLLYFSLLWLAGGLRQFWDALVAGVCFFLMVLPLYAYQAYYGAYAQTFAMGFYTLAFCFTKARRFKLGVVTLLWAGWCYPDGLLWFLPVLAWSLTESLADSRTRCLVWGIAAAMTLPVFLILVKRMELVGGPSPQVVWGTLVLGIWTGYRVIRSKLLQGRSLELAERLAFVFLSLVLALLAYSVLQYSEPPYHLRKTLYWTPLVFSILVIDRHRDWRHALPPLLAALVMTVVVFAEFRGNHFRALREYVRGTTGFSRADERQLLSLAAPPCQRPAFLPTHRGADSTTLFLVSLLAGNGYFGTYDIYNGSLHGEGPDPWRLYPVDAANNYLQGSRHLITTILGRESALEPQKARDCWIIRHPRDVDPAWGSYALVRSVDQGLSRWSLVSRSP